MSINEGRRGLGSMLKVIRATQGLKEGKEGPNETNSFVAFGGGECRRNFRVVIQIRLLERAGERNF